VVYKGNTGNGNMCKGKTSKGNLGEGTMMGKGYYTSMGKVRIIKGR
jgi:hypothetical protein